MLFTNGQNTPEELNKTHIFPPFIVKFLRGPSFRSWCELWELTLLHKHKWWETDQEKIQEGALWSSRIVCDLQSAARLGFGSPLYYAAHFGFRSVAELLFNELDYDPNELGGPESYPILAAVENRHILLTALLLKKGADINVKHNTRRHTAVHRAIDKGEKDVLQFLLSQTPDLGICNSRGLPPLHLAIKKFTEPCDTNFDPAFIEMLANESSINVKDERGRTATHFAAWRDSYQSVSMLVQENQEKVDVNLTDDYGRTALHAASRNGNAEMVDLLLENEANVIIADQLGYTAVHQAVCSGNRQIFATLYGKLGFSIPLNFSHVAPKTVVYPSCDVF